MKNINSSIDVCDDFYEHVCSGWKKKNPANAQTELVNQLYVLKIKTMRQLKGSFRATLKSALKST